MNLPIHRGNGHGRRVRAIIGFDNGKEAGYITVKVDTQATQGVIVSPHGDDIALEHGKTLAARVVSYDRNTQQATLSIAGRHVEATSSVPLEPGSTIQLKVELSGQSAGQPSHSASAQLSSAATLQLRVVPQASATPLAGQQPGAGSLPTSASRTLSDLAPAAIRALAREGVPVTAEATRAIVQVLERSNVPSGEALEQQARSLAAAAGRNMPAQPGISNAISAAMQQAGKLQQSLMQLGTVAADVSAAAPNQPPSPATVRQALVPDLPPEHVALARLTQAVAAVSAARSTTGTSAPTNGALVTSLVPEHASPQVAASIVASTAAHAEAMKAYAPPSANATGAAATNTTAAGTQPLLPGTPATVDQQAVIAAKAAGQVEAQVQAQMKAAETRPAPPATGTGTPLSPTTKSLAGTTTGAHAATNVSSTTANEPDASLTRPNVAQVSAGAAITLGRYAQMVAPTEGAPGVAMAQQARAALSQSTRVVPGGSFVPEAAGGSGTGTQQQLVTVVQNVLASAHTHPDPGHNDGQAHEQQELARHLSQLAQADPKALSHAFQTLPQRETLATVHAALTQFLQAGNGEITAEMRHAARALLHELGIALVPPQLNPGDDLALLRNVLNQVAADHTRAPAAEMAQRVLDAADGAQIVSAAKAGNDTGYVYFQLPLPNQTSAEVIVRREPGRKTISFDQFSIAFLLNTQTLGTLMIQLDAHPAGMNVLVRTDQPAAEPVLREQAELLKEPLERASARPMNLSIGIFDADHPVPDSLLMPELGYIPGENAYYA